MEAVVDYFKVIVVDINLTFHIAAFCSLLSRLSPPPDPPPRDCGGRLQKKEGERKWTNVSLGTTSHKKLGQRT